MSLNIWTPNQGSSGLIIIPQPSPILLVVGGQIQPWTPEPSAHVIRPPSSQTMDLQRTPSGLIIIKQRSQKPKRTIGHPEIATGASVRKDDTLFISIGEAIYRQQQGEDIELHFTSTQEDDRTLAYTKEQVWKQWESDSLPDGWTRPRSNRPRTPKEGVSDQPHRNEASMEPVDLTSALNRLRQLRDHWTITT